MFYNSEDPISDFTPLRICVLLSNRKIHGLLCT